MSSNKLQWLNDIEWAADMENKETVAAAIIHSNQTLCSDPILNTDQNSQQIIKQIIKWTRTNEINNQTDNHIEDIG